MLLWADNLKKRLGRAIEKDSVMTYNKHAYTFYPRRFSYVATYLKAVTP